MFNFFSFEDMLADRIAEVADLTPEQAEALEFGATTVIGILSNAAGEVGEEATIAELFDFAQPSIDALQKATIAAQVGEAEAETEDPYYDLFPDEDEDESLSTEAIDDMLEGLFGILIGTENAAAVRREVEARRAEVEEVQPEDEFDKFLADLLAGRV